MRRLATPCLVACVALLVGPSAGTIGAAGEAAVKPAIIAAEQERSTYVATSRSLERLDCAAERCAAPKPPVKPSVTPRQTAPVKPAAPRTNCPKNVSKVWSGPCPSAPSKAQVQEMMREVLAAHGWAGQFDCLNAIIDHESDWNVYAVNSSSLAYGLGQALPGNKMAAAGSDWGWNARTQLRWQVNIYIASRYGTPCGAWSFWQAHHWY